MVRRPSCARWATATSGSLSSARAYNDFKDVGMRTDNASNYTNGHNSRHPAVHGLA